MKEKKPACFKGEIQNWYDSSVSLLCVIETCERLGSIGRLVVRRKY